MNLVTNLWLLKPNTNLSHSFNFSNSTQRNSKFLTRKKKIIFVIFCQNFFPLIYFRPKRRDLSPFNIKQYFLRDVVGTTNLSATHTCPPIKLNSLINNLSPLSLFVHLNLERRIFSLIHMTCILSCSHGVVIATAMVFSSTALFLTISRQLSGNHQTSDQQILRPCLCSGTFLSSLTILRLEKVSKFLVSSIQRKKRNRGRRRRRWSLQRMWKSLKGTVKSIVERGKVYGETYRNRWLNRIRPVQFVETTCLLTGLLCTMGFLETEIIEFSAPINFCCFFFWRKKKK